jgi:hypothetical protein
MAESETARAMNSGRLDRCGGMNTELVPKPQWLVDTEYTFPTPSSQLSADRLASFRRFQLRAEKLTKRGARIQPDFFLPDLISRVRSGMWPASTLSVPEQCRSGKKVRCK